MAIIRKSPFKVNKVESDPQAFGLRYEEIHSSVQSLHNSQSILISGPRGIGKSSLGSQLQRILEGDITLLERAGIETKLPNQVCAFYACDSEITLGDLALDILRRLENELFEIMNKGSESSTDDRTKLTAISQKLETELEKRKLPQSTIASYFVEALQRLSRILQRLPARGGFNIFVDEVDLVSPALNFAHFVKVVHENLNNAGLGNITFIFAGQEGIYTRLNAEDNSFERIVRHIPLGTLDADAADHILEYAAGSADPPFTYDSIAKKMLISISSGYPYVVHLVGNAAFFEMQTPETMSKDDVMAGIQSVLRSDKREKYLEIINQLSMEERLVLTALTEFLPNTLPAQIPIAWIERRLIAHFKDNERLNTIIDALVDKRFLVRRKDIKCLIFQEELFRIFLAIARMEQKEIQARKLRKMGSDIKKSDEDLLMLIDLVNKGKIDYRTLVEGLPEDDKDDVLAGFEDEFKNGIYSSIQELLRGASYETPWEDEDVLELEGLDFAEEPDQDNEPFR